VEQDHPSEEQLIALAKADPEAIGKLCFELFKRVAALQAKVESLEAKIAELERNSRTSSKPPSSDSGNFTNPPKPKSLRGKSGRKPGGQKGRRGDTLERVADPDHLIEHRLSRKDLCPKCGTAMDEAAGELSPENCECRQVFELPAIRLEITEHRAEKRPCHQCGSVVTAVFPEGVLAPVQYGPKVRAAALYLGAYQLVPYQRLSEIFSDLFNAPLSVGTLANIIKRGGARAKETMKPVREALVKVEVAHADETGCRVKGKRQWLHVFSTAKLTSFHIDTKRGYEGMNRIGLLERFKGSLIHDFLSSYYQLLCSHFLCAAHLLRELTYLHEQMDQPWAKDMIELLLKAKKLREREDAREPKQRHVIGEQTRQNIRRRYCEIVIAGLAINPEPSPNPKRRGRPKRGKALNMLIRLEDRYEEIMGFFEHEGVPFDNNQAERDLRMMKVREKISGTFRTAEHATLFADIRGVVSTARKQSRNLLATLAEMLHAPETLGESLVEGAKS
jgi:transposase